MTRGPALPLRPDPASRETLFSFVSRLAAYNALSLQAFCFRLDIKLKELLDLEVNAVEKIGHLSGLEPERVADMTSWTGVPSGNIQVSFRGSSFSSRLIRSPIVRACPKCLQEDIASGHGDPLTKTVMRGDWLLRSVSACVRHRHPIVPLWDVAGKSARYDVGRQMAPLIDDLVDGRFDTEELDLSGYDLWLDDRLSRLSDSTWLAKMSLQAAVIFLRLLGKTLRDTKNKNGDDDTDERAEMLAGFDLAAAGEPAVRDHLIRLGTQAGGAKDGPRVAYGDLYRRFSTDLLDDDDFAYPRGLIRDCILEVWPLGPDDSVLGSIVGRRRLHSVLSAATETGNGSRFLDRILVHEGVLQIDDRRPLARKVFDAERHHQLLEDLPRLVGPSVMREALGATHTQFSALVSLGYLKPRVGLPGMESPWKLADAHDLLREFRAIPGVKDDDSRWETLAFASNRTKMSLEHIFEAMRAGRFRSAHVEGEAGLGSLRLLSADVDTATPSALARREETDGALLTLAEFGRTIGLRDGKTFPRLVAAGLTPSTSTTDWKGQRKSFLSEADRQAFHDRFMTVSTMVEEWNLHANAVNALLKKHRVNAFAVNGVTFPSIFERTETMKMIGSAARGVSGSGRTSDRR